MRRHPSTTRQQLTHRRAGGVSPLIRPSVRTQTAALRISRLTPAARRRALALDSRLSTLDSCRGFTLVEMLVSVALVVIMMAMFATVFQLAAGSIGTQRGIAENDQRARSVTTVLRNDLENRSFKKVLPFDNAVPSTITDGALRRGYFYISENDPNNETDDVLQFTVELPGTTGDFYVGKATRLSGLSAATTFLNSNEPDRDDGLPSADNSSDSLAAEISYFLRNGRLYRRVLLIRSPLLTTDATQPSDTNGFNYFDPTNNGMGMPKTPTAYTGDFWNEFDLSVHMKVNAGTIEGARVHGTEHLDNVVVAPIFTGASALGNPSNRFGHNHADGQPREFVITDFGANGKAGGGDDTIGFIGRYTHEETSDPDFNYPQANSTLGTVASPKSGNPMSTLELPMADGVVTAFAAGPRRAEDLLLSNVHAFDVKVWDETLGQFVDVGHAQATGDFRLAVRTNTNYGPAGTATKRVFDTWHPDLDGDGTVNDTPPPFTLTKRLRAIQITIRFLDISSNQMRQLTLQVSLMNE